MGLLTDPGAGRGKLTQLLVIYHNKLSIVFYVIGILWFAVLAHDNFNAGTYFSENALLPGLVRSDYEEKSVAKRYLKELLDEASRYPHDVPYSWLLAKFGQLNLETYTHNFTLNYPLGLGNVYKGKNVYAILRAPRSASTEALVLSVPYRPPNSVYPSTFPSIALMLSLAQFFRWQKYWAKDIIFLVTEHEQLGVQAWLEAYHQVSCGRPGILDHGDMMGRAGAIQAAVNLELHAESISHIDIKVEGLNGQLPNLDLVNLMHRMCSKESVKHTFKNRENANFRDEFSEWSYSFTTLMAMVSTQATGIPNGNHGLFHRFGIEAVTLEGFEKKGRGHTVDFYQLGRVLEGVFRSLNNLLERFHQSYFFYLLPATDRYISIGMYMPSLGLLCAGVLIKAFALWLKIHDDKKDSENKEQIEMSKSTTASKLSETESIKSEHKDTGKILNVTKSKLDKLSEVVINKDINLGVVYVGMTFLVTHSIGIFLLSAAEGFSFLTSIFPGFSTGYSVFLGYTICSLLLLFIPKAMRSYKRTPESYVLLLIVALLELATLLLAVAMHNFSLSLFTATLYVPPVLWLSPTTISSVKQQTLKVWWILLHPLVLLILTVGCVTIYNFPELSVISLLIKGYQSSQRALVYAIVDSYVYGNWVFTIATSVLLPNWLLFWVILGSKPENAN